MPSTLQNSVYLSSTEHPASPLYFATFFQPKKPRCDVMTLVTWVIVNQDDAQVHQHWRKSRQGVALIWHQTSRVPFLQFHTSRLALDGWFPLLLSFFIHCFIFFLLFCQSVSVVSEVSKVSNLMFKYIYLLFYCKL